MAGSRIAKDRIGREMISEVGNDKNATSERGKSSAAPKDVIDVVDVYGPRPIATG
jgi:hypothetical protein